MSAVLQNWDLVEATKNTALTSEGSMDRQLEIYNESIQASINRFKVAFQELSADIMSSDVVKGVVDFGTSIIKFIDELIKRISVLGTALAGLGISKLIGVAVGGARSVELASDSVELLGKALESAQSSGAGFGGMLKGLTGVLGNFGAKASGAGSALGGLFSSMGAFLTSPAGLITAGVAAVAGVTAYIYKRRKDQEEALRKQANETTDRWNEGKSDLDEYAQQYTKLNDQLEAGNLTESERIEIKQQLLDLQNQINEQYGTNASQLDLINGKYETQLGLITQIKEKEAHRSLQDNREAYQQSIDEMTKDRSYKMWSNGSGSELMKQIEWAYIRSGFKDQGDLSFEFTGDVSEADEGIRNLIDRLETLKDTANETEKAFIDNVIGSATKLLTKNNEILKANQDNYKAYLEQSLYDDGYGDELSKYSRLVQEYNDALAGDDVEYAYKKRSEMLAYYRDNIDGVFENTQYQEFFDGVTEQIDTTTERMMDWRDIVDDETTYASNKFIKSADTIRKTVDKLKALELDGVDIQAILGNPNDAMYADLSQLAKLWDPNIDLSNSTALQAFADFLEKIGAVSGTASDGIDLATASFGDFLKSASNSLDTIDKVNGALVKSFASGGMSARIDQTTGALTGDVAEIIKAYQNLDNFDVQKVFERTASGIIVNRDALRELQAEQEKATKEEFANRITEAYTQWQKAMRDGNTEAAQTWKTHYDNVRLLAGAYDGATSAYQKWLDAQKMGEAGDMYDAVASTALKRGEELYNKGLTGTNEFRAIAQLYSSKDLTTATRDEIYEAYEEGYKVVKKYFTEGQEGAQAFADKLVELGHATKEGDMYDFFNGIDTKKIADELGISVDLVESAFKKLGDYDFDIHFSFNDATSALTQFQNRLDEINASGVDIDINNDEELRGIAEYLLSLDDEEIKPIIDLEGADTVEEVIELLQQKYTVQTTVATDTSNVPTTMSTVVDAAVEINQNDIKIADQTVHVEPEPNPIEAPVVAKLDDTEVVKYKPDDKPATVKYDVDDSKPKAYQPDNKYATAYYDVSVDTSGLSALPKDGDRRTVYIDTVERQLYTGTVSKSAFQGMSHVRGTVGGRSHASGLLGKVGLKSNENALINELGPEIVVRPSDDSWMIFNNGKPTFASLKKDDVIFNSEMSEELLRTGKADDYARFLGSSLLNGTVKGKAHATVRGGGKFRKTTTTSTKKSSGGGGGGGGGGNGSSNKEEKEFSEILDEIEIKIDRIERSIKNLDTVASNTFNSMYTRQSALSKEISKTTEELEIQKRGYKRYMKEADKYANGLSADIIRRIQNGEIDIQEFKDEDTWNKIENYKKYYEQALACRDAVYELQQAEADLWQQRFDVAQTNYENKIAQIQHIYDMMDSYIEMAENNGRITTNKYRQKQITEENKKLKELQKEYDGLKEKMKEAIESGTLIVGSEAYYDMLNQLNSVREEIAETNANISELNKSVRETNWDIFDKGVEKISQASDELEFLYELLGEELYDDKGGVTDSGIAGFGILASQYNLAMIEAQKYAEEIKKLNNEIASDPYNQDLIDRRTELYESQRDMIEQANEYKESIRDLVKEGIDKQIDSLKELVKNYEDLIDSQKDEMDYAKKIASQQENINKLQKQLNAYANDNSEEGATRRQRLRNELKNAQENLQQTQEERRIGQTKKMLSDLQEEYENILNARLDNLDALVEAVVDGVNKNSTIVSSAIKAASDNVGYTMTHELETMFGGDKDLVSYFTGGKFVEDVTKAVAVATNIQNKIDEAVNNTNTSQSKDIKNVVSDQNKTLNDLSSYAKTGVKTKNYRNKTTGLDGRWVTDSKKQRIGWTFNDGTKATGWSKIDNEWYYFNNDGKIRSGLQDIGKYKYYLKRYGGRATNEWVQVGKKWYYFDKDGHAVTGWHNLEKDGKKGWRYFYKNSGVMAKGAWIKDSSKKGTYYVDGNGLMVANGKFKTKDGWRTFDKDGKWKGYKLGARSVGADGLYWTNEGAPETIIRKSDGAILTKLNTGDTVFNNDATKTMWGFANDPIKFLRGLGIANGGTGNDVDLVINLNGVKNPAEFMDALRRDKKFERFVQEITIGRVGGHGVLAKNAIAF